jgi:hypothetical protein
MPEATTMALPSITGTAQAAGAPIGNTGGIVQNLSPVDLLKPMPSIVDTSPTVVPGVACDSISQWVNDNPMLAIGALALLAMFIYHGKK